MRLAQMNHAIFSKINLIQYGMLKMKCSITLVNLQNIPLNQYKSPFCVQHSGTSDDGLNYCLNVRLLIKKNKLFLITAIVRDRFGFYFGRHYTVSSLNNTAVTKIYIVSRNCEEKFFRFNRVPMSFMRIALVLNVIGLPSR